MKTNFLPRSRQRVQSRKRQVLIIAGILIAGMTGFTFFGGYLTRLFAPLWHSNILVETGISNLIGSLRSKDVLIQENADLKQRLAQSEELITSLRAIASSRDELLRVFGRAIDTNDIPAGVLVHPPETPYDILIVDAGENLGVLPASLVSTPQGVAIGTVSFVSSRTSQVKLYSTAGERTDAVLERGGLSVTLIGRGGGNMKFSVPRDLPVEVGDRVLMPHLAAELVAVVGDIESTPTDSEKTVYARSPANPNNQRFVIIHR